jgi:S1-C subfamily serine protease
MKKPLSSIIILFVMSFVFAPVLFCQTSISGSIVKVYTVYDRHSYFRPWQMEGQKRLSGSGCIIKGNRILTNAHVVADSTFIQVKRAGVAEKYTAEVEIVAHECDLAILKVADKSFFSGAEPLEIGELAHVRDKVAAYGFPEGGEELAITEGVVSRVELQEYTHSKAKLLACQIDAAINPGSSGGPVIMDDKVVGVAFEAAQGENIGYMVPVVVINHFLKDIADGKYDGIPDLGISWQAMENPALKQKYNMSKNHTGILVNKIYPGSPANGVLKAKDIILSIDGVDVANDGTIEFRQNERTDFRYAIQNKDINETSDFEILRDGKVMNVKIQLTIPVNYCRLVPYERYDVAPTYYIVGGLVFQKLTRNYLDARLRDEGYHSENFFNLFPYYDTGEPTEDRREIVVLASVLADETNVGYQALEDIVVSHANGQKISTIRDLAKAVEMNNEKYHVFIDEHGKEIVLDKAGVAERSSIILKKYKVPSGRSEDLKQL